VINSIATALLRILLYSLGFILIALPAFGENTPDFTSSLEDLYADSFLNQPITEPWPTEDVRGCTELNFFVVPHINDMHTGERNSADLEYGIDKSDATQLLAELPPSTNVTQVLAHHIRMEIKKKKEALKNNQRDYGPDCLKKLSLQNEFLSVISISIYDRYRCNSQGCYLPIQISKLLCFNLACRGISSSTYPVQVVKDFTESEDKISRMASHIVHLALSRPL
jgi:hypothetical protein